MDATRPDVGPLVDFHGFDGGDWRRQSDQGHVGVDGVGPPVVFGMNHNLIVPYVDVALTAIVCTASAHVSNSPAIDDGWIDAVVAFGDALWIGRYM